MKVREDSGSAFSKGQVGFNKSSPPEVSVERDDTLFACSKTEACLTVSFPSTISVEMVFCNSSISPGSLESRSARSFLAEIKSAVLSLSHSISLLSSKPEESKQHKYGEERSRGKWSGTPVVES